MFKEFTNYLQDNPKGYWFKAKWYGWGWVPARWQGWVVVALYIVLITLVVENAESKTSSNPDTFFGLVVPSLVLTLGLLAVCYLKGEKPHWSWGRPKKKKRPNFPT